VVISTLHSLLSSDNNNNNNSSNGGGGIRKGNGDGLMKVGFDGYTVYAHDGGTLMPSAKGGNSVGYLTAICRPSSFSSDDDDDTTRGEEFVVAAIKVSRSLIDVITSSTLNQWLQADKVLAEASVAASDPRTFGTASNGDVEEGVDTIDSLVRFEDDVVWPLLEGLKING
jgi:hypothetical protein